MFAANALADVFPTRPLVRDSASIANPDLVAAWLGRCAEGHKNKECSQLSTTLPTRVLDVGVAGDIIRLVDGAQYEGPYAALSYCVRSVQMSLWGHITWRTAADNPVHSSSGETHLLSLHQTKL